MAGGGFAADVGPVTDYGGRVTFSVFVTCLLAASGGLIFGYDIGISGGVSGMESFLQTFFPSILKKMANAKQNEYCLYDSQALTAFTSSLYIAGVVASLVASHVTKAIGRRAIMLMGGALFFAGAALDAAAVNLPMLIIGRMLLGFGVGFTNLAAPLYLAEMAPPRWRGAFTAGFQFFLALGMLIANITNYLTSRIPNWGWRLSLGLAAAPASVIVLGALFLTDTPSSLAMRGKLDQARAALRRVRGPDADVEAELKDIVRAVEEARKYEEGAFRRIVRREHRPHLVLGIAVPMFFQLTGVIALAFFAPLLFRTVGFGSDASLMGNVILGAVNLASLLLSTLAIDRYGRRFLFMVGGVQMVICEVAIAWIMGAKLGSSGEGSMPKAYGVAVLIFTCLQAAGFGWSWGPLGWVIPSEIFPVEIRSAGQAMNVSISLGLTAIQTQSFLAMLCTFKYATFAYYAGWVTVMTIFIALFLPETKGIPLDSMGSVWGRHWYWKRFVTQESKNSELEATN